MFAFEVKCKQSSQFIYHSSSFFITNHAFQVGDERHYSFAAAVEQSITVACTLHNRNYIKLSLLTFFFSQLL
jgi:hypothetical protein